MTSEARIYETTYLLTNITDYNLMHSKNIDREQAMILLKKMVSNKSLIIHSLSVALVMNEYAIKLNEDEDSFYITGLLHDADYEKFPKILLECLIF